MYVNKNATGNTDVFNGLKSLRSVFMLSKKGGFKMKEDSAGFMLQVTPGMNVTPHHILVCPHERKGADNWSVSKLKNASDEDLKPYTKPQLMDMTEPEFTALSEFYYDNALKPLANGGKEAPASIVMIINNGGEAGQTVPHSHWHRLEFNKPLPEPLENMIARGERDHFKNHKGKHKALPDEFKIVETHLMPDFLSSGEPLPPVHVERKPLHYNDPGKVKGGHHTLQTKHVKTFGALQVNATDMPIEKNGLPKRDDFIALMKGVRKFDKILHDYFNVKATSIFAEFNLKNPQDGPKVHIVPYSEKAPARGGGAVYYLRDEIRRYNP